MASLSFLDRPIHDFTDAYRVPVLAYSWGHSYRDASRHSLANMCPCVRLQGLSMTNLPTAGSTEIWEVTKERIAMDKVQKTGADLKARLKATPDYQHGGNLVGEVIAYIEELERERRDFLSAAMLLAERAERYADSLERQAKAQRFNARRALTMAGIENG